MNNFESLIYVSLKVYSNCYFPKISSFLYLHDVSTNYYNLNVFFMQIQSYMRHVYLYIYIVYVLYYIYIYSICAIL